TNGTPLFRKFASFPYFFVGGFVNLSILTNKIVELLNRSDVYTIFLACAGQDNNFAFEDALFCGNLIDILITQLSEEELKLNDASLASLEMYLLHKSDLISFVKTTNHALNLIQNNFEMDIDFAFQRDTTPIIPTFNGLSIVPLR
ncbi:MAG: 2-phosphosulfolactate phosphatase, partial [Candidatus Kapaibacteriota bacterium]